MTLGQLDPQRQQLVVERARRVIEETKSFSVEEIAAIETELRKRSYSTLKGFVQGAWHVVEPQQNLVWNWHLDVLCEQLEKIYRGEQPKTIINVPPGTMKSLLVSVFFRAFCWSKNPTLRFLVGSYGGHLSTQDNVKLRNIIISDWFKKEFPSVALAGDQNAKEYFETTAGGWSFATSVGGAGTGKHPDYVLIDDPVTEAQARSEAERNAANSWIDGTLSTRGIVRNVRSILIMQRFDEDDPSGHLLKKGSWKHICFPMRFEASRKDPLDRRSREGELLWPTLFTEEKVTALEKELTEYGVAGQLQQRPTPITGGLFKHAWFADKIVDAAPAVLRKVRGWDTASTEDGGDYTVGVLIGEECVSRAGEMVSTGRFFIVDVKREQLGPDGVDGLIRLTTELDGKECAQREEKEGGSAGLAVIAARTKTLKGYDYAGVSVTGNKITRSKPFRAQCEAGNVYLLRGAWNTKYLNELCDFKPGCKHDDQVDASSCAFNAVLLEPIPEEAEGTWGR